MSEKILSNQQVKLAKKKREREREGKTGFNDGMMLRFHIQ